MSPRIEYRVRFTAGQFPHLRVEWLVNGEAPRRLISSPVADEPTAEMILAAHRLREVTGTRVYGGDGDFTAALERVR